MKATVNGEVAVAGSHFESRGTGGGMEEKINGVNWGSCCSKPRLSRRAETFRTKNNKAERGATVSDEAVVSDDPKGQYNLRGSQGPLDRIVVKGQTRTEIALIGYSLAGDPL